MLAPFWPVADQTGWFQAKRLQELKARCPNCHGFVGPVQRMHCSERMRKRLCIFVVDDDTDLSKSTGTLLKTLGHDLPVFNPAEGAVTALDIRPPDLILADMERRGMDGCELARHVKQRPNCEKVVLAAITGFGEEEHRRQAIEAGFDYRFVKP